jgi:hypothetical protein
MVKTDELTNIQGDRHFYAQWTTADVGGRPALHSRVVG